MRIIIFILPTLLIEEPLYDVFKETGSFSIRTAVIEEAGVHLRAAFQDRYKLAAEVWSEWQRAMSLRLRILNMFRCYRRRCCRWP